MTTRRTFIRTGALGLASAAALAAGQVRRRGHQGQVRPGLADPGAAGALHRGEDPGGLQRIRPRRDHRPRHGIAEDHRAGGHGHLRPRLRRHQLDDRVQRQEPRQPAGRRLHGAQHAAVLAALAEEVRGEAAQGPEGLRDRRAGGRCPAAALAHLRQERRPGRGQRDLDQHGAAAARARPGQGRRQGHLRLLLHRLPESRGEPQGPGGRRGGLPLQQVRHRPLRQRGDRADGLAEGQRGHRCASSWPASTRA